MSGRRERGIRVNGVGAREKIGKFELEFLIVKHLVGRLDGRPRIRAYQRLQHVLYSIPAWGHLECLAQRTVLPFCEDNRGILTSDEKSKDI